MTTVRLYAAPLAAPLDPRGARAGAARFVALYRLLAGLFRAATARQRERLPDVQAVRDLARRHQASDPGFAADLLAAADRHEVLHGLG